MLAFSKDGSQITRCMQIALVTYGLQEDSFDHDGTGDLSFDYDDAGGDVDWDSIEVRTKKGKVLFMDGCGDEYTVEEIILVDECELSDDADEDGTIGALSEKKFEELRADGATAESDYDDWFTSQIQHRLEEQNKRKGAA
jgi:hypothetical protein